MGQQMWNEATHKLAASRRSTPEAIAEATLPLELLQHLYLEMKPSSIHGLQGTACCTTQTVLTAQRYKSRIRATICDDSVGVRQCSDAERSGLKVHDFPRQSHFAPCVWAGRGPSSRRAANADPVQLWVMCDEVAKDAEGLHWV